MCVIIDRKPGTEIPMANLETACDINKHGFGFSFVEDGKLVTERSLTDNDPKVVAALLEKHRDKRVFLHLRYATVGAVDEANSHPVSILNMKDHGIDLAMMHNGTLSEYKPVDKGSTESDTVKFATVFARPLALRSWCLQRRLKDKTPLDDWFFKQMVAREIRLTMSVLLFFDGRGNVLTLGGGKEFEWGWASNDYSFDTNHHRSSKSQWQSYGTMMTGWEDDYCNQHGGRSSTSTGPIPWARSRVINRQRKGKSPEGPWVSWEQVFEPKKGTTEEPVPFDADIDHAILKMDAKAINLKLQKEWKVTERSLVQDIKNIQVNLAAPRSKFIEIVGITDVSEIERLSRKDFIDLCENHPNAMAELFIDLMVERRDLKRSVQMANANTP